MSIPATKMSALLSEARRVTSSRDVEEDPDDAADDLPPVEVSPAPSLAGAADRAVDAVDEGEASAEAVSLASRPEAVTDPSTWQLLRGLVAARLGVDEDKLDGDDVVAVAVAYLEILKARKP